MGHFLRTQYSRLFGDIDAPNVILTEDVPGWWSYDVCVRVQNDECPYIIVVDVRCKVFKQLGSWQVRASQRALSKRLLFTNFCNLVEFVIIIIIIIY